MRPSVSGRLTMFACISAALAVPAVGGVQSESVPQKGGSTMVVVVSRDESLLEGGIGSSKWTGKGTAVAEPMAYLSLDGTWSGIPCSWKVLDSCGNFARDYQSKPHSYTVVSPDGYGAEVAAKPTTLSECSDYSGPADYRGAVLKRAAVAVSSPDGFGLAEAPKLLDSKESALVRGTLSRLIPKFLDHTARLRVSTFQIGGQTYYAIQRTFADIPSDAHYQDYKFVFLIGQMENGRFQLAYQANPDKDEVEQIVSTVNLVDGRNFLVTVIHDEESHRFHVYGIREGKLSLVYEGGGASC